MSRKEAVVPNLRRTLVLLVVLAAPADAQSGWGIGLEVGIQRLWGASGPLPGSEELAFRPYRPTHVGVRVDRDVGGLRLGFGARYAQCAAGGEYPGGATLFTEGFTLLELAPEAGMRLVRLGGGAAVRSFGGPVISIWGPPDDASRARLGVRVGLEVEAPVGSRVRLVTRLHAGVGGSALDEDDVPVGYEVRSMPSAGVSVGFKLGL
jgi:hypothetical protein